MVETAEETRTRKKARMDRNVFWALVAVVASGVASFILAIAFAQHAADNARAQAEASAHQAQLNAVQFTRQFCKVIVILDNVYQSAPAGRLTNEQKEFVAAMHQLRADYKCDDK